jgi:hypothetical protein
MRPDVHSAAGCSEPCGGYTREPRPPVRTPAALQSLGRAQPDRSAGHGAAAAGHRVDTYTAHAT